MLSGSFISIIFLLVEISFALGVVVYLVQKKLRSSRQENKKLEQILEDERSPKKFREKLKDYFEREISRTTEKYDQLKEVGESEKNQVLLLARKSTLDVEKRMLQKNPLDLDFWSSLQTGYATIFTRASESESASNATPAEIPEVDIKPTASSNSTLNINTASGEELGRLRNVVNNQYATIDELKRQLKNIGSDSILADHPALAELHRQISRLVQDQNQMAMCVKVLEAENTRLTEAVEAAQALPDEFDQMTGANSESEAIKSLAQELQQAENLIRDLLRTNKEQLQCIATLESELDMIHDSATVDPNEATLSLQKSKLEVKQLNQEKLQHLATIDKLRQELDNVKATPLTPANGSSTGEYKNLEKQLHAKIAELELLREEYKSMHEKYIKLHQDKAS